MRPPVTFPAVRSRHRHQHFVCLTCIRLFNEYLRNWKSTVTMEDNCCICGSTSEHLVNVTFPILLGGLRCTEFNFSDALDRAFSIRRTS